MTILEELAQITRTRPEQLKDRKAKGTKLVGYTGRFVPEELIHASGAVPYLLCRDKVSYVRSVTPRGVDCTAHECMDP